MRFNEEHFTSDKKRIFISGILAIIVLYTLFSYVVSLLAFISPSQELRWEGSGYTNQPSFGPGDTVTVAGILEEGTEFFDAGDYFSFSTTEDVRWVIIVIDPNNMPVHMETDVRLGASGDFYPAFNFDLPIDAVLGTYRIRVFVWTGWLPTGETRTNLIHEITFWVGPT